MEPTKTILEGTLKPDGTLVLDSIPDVPAGRVQVMVQAIPNLPVDHPFWDMMRSIWAGQKERGHVPRSVAEVETEQQEMRHGWARRQGAIERLQEEARRLREEQS